MMRLEIIVKFIAKFIGKFIGKFIYKSCANIVFVVFFVFNIAFLGAMAPSAPVVPDAYPAPLSAPEQAGQVAPVTVQTSGEYPAPLSAPAVSDSYPAPLSASPVPGQVAPTPAQMPGAYPAPLSAPAQATQVAPAQTQTSGEYPAPLSVPSGVPAQAGQVAPVTVQTPGEYPAPLSAPVAPGQVAPTPAQMPGAYPAPLTAPGQAAPALPQAPQAAPEKVIEDVKSGNAEIDGLDTVSVTEPEGNWLLKRYWWEKAQKKYEKIKDIVTKTMESRTPFFEKRNELEKNVLNPFYSATGLNNGQIMEIVDDISSKIKKDRAENVTLDEKEREFLESVKEEESKLKQLETDITGIKNLDEAINKDLGKLDEQITRSKKYEDLAWKLFNDISKELSHKKARELYHAMDALWQNVQNIDAYIRNAFSKHFDSIVENANSQISRIKGTLEQFKSKGLDLKNRYEQLKKDPKILEQEKAKAAAEAAAKAAEKEELEKPGILGSIWNGVTWPFRTVWELISSIWS